MFRCEHINQCKIIIYIKSRISQALIDPTLVAASSGTYCTFASTTCLSFDCLACALPADLAACLGWACDGKHNVYKYYVSDRHITSKIISKAYIKKRRTYQKTYLHLLETYKPIIMISNKQVASVTIKKVVNTISNTPVQFQGQHTTSGPNHEQVQAHLHSIDHQVLRKAPIAHQQGPDYQFLPSKVAKNRPSYYRTS